MTRNDERQLGRAKNAVLNFFESRLSIPKIYIDADWGGHHVDVLAINRDGVGDVHAVLTFMRPYRLEDAALSVPGQEEVVEGLIQRFQAIPAQYKYIAAIEPTVVHHAAPLGLPSLLMDELFSSDGIGRIGLILVDGLPDGEPGVKLEIKPERFRAKIAKLADEYVQQHEADWEIRA